MYLLLSLALDCNDAFYAHEINQQIIYINAILSYPILHNTIQRGRADDPVAYLLAAEQRARERQVAYETVRLLREQVQECCRKEGINQYENCKDITQKLYDVVIQKDLGQLHPEWSNPAKHDGW